MTHRSDDQSFEDAFDNAVREMHQQMPRGDRPSSRAWELVTQKGKISGEQMPPELDRTPSEERHPLQSRLARVDSSTANRVSNHLGWSTWLAAALVVVLIGASVNFLMPDNDNGINRDVSSIALAPGTPDISTLEPAGIASPSASPDLYTPVHGPEFACTVEPMTEEQIYRIVLNPANGYVTDSADSHSGDSGLYEGSNHWMSSRFERQASEGYIATDEPSLVDPITETANTFWNCLMNGSALQVWSLMEPSAVQHEILIQYPVFRDEEMIRRHIREWGPRRYSASIYHVFPDLGDVPSNNASKQVVDAYGAVRIGYSGEDPWKALVLMQSHPEATGYQESYLLLKIAPNGTWWVSMIFYE